MHLEIEKKISFALKIFKFHVSFTLWKLTYNAFKSCLTIGSIISCKEKLWETIMVYDFGNKTSLNENSLGRKLDFLGLHLKYSTAFLLAEFHVNSRYEHVCMNSGANIACPCVWVSLWVVKYVCTCLCLHVGVCVFFTLFSWNNYLRGDATVVTKMHFQFEFFQRFLFIYLCFFFDEVQVLSKS